LSPSQIVERERARARPVAIIAFVIVALFIAAVAVKGTSGSSDAATESQLLADYDSGPELLGSILQGLGFILLAIPLVYLFRAAAARSETMREQFVGVAYAGPILLGLGVLALWLGFDNAASTFTTSGEGTGIPVGEYAEDVLNDEIFVSISQGMAFAGGLGTGIMVFYASRHALRTGLLTRFTGSLGMAVGIIMLLFGLSGPAIYGLLSASLLALFFYFWLIQLGMTFSGWRSGGRPPAWDEGVAVPWQPPGQPEEDEEESDSDRPADPDEFAATIEGTGAEVESGDEGAGDAPAKRKRRGSSD
jgi:hypothetical protein